jgi:hypothetical protein
VPIAVFADGTVVGDSTKIVDKVAGSEVWPYGAPNGDGRRWW